MYSNGVLFNLFERFSDGPFLVKEIDLSITYTLIPRLGYSKKREKEEGNCESLGFYSRRPTPNMSFEKGGVEQGLTQR